MARVSLSLALCFALVACAGEPPPRPPVFVVVLDAAAAAYFGVYGDPHDTTPRIDAFAARSLVFENAYSQSATTVSSTASLFTGVRVQTHRVTGDQHLPDALETLGEWLRGAGYHSLAVIGNPFAGSSALAFDRGFDRSVPVYALGAVQRARAKEGKLLVTRPGEVNGVLFGMLTRFWHGPTFAYVHYLQPHMPYDPPPQHLEPFLPVVADGKPCPLRSISDLRHQWHVANRSGEVDACTRAEIETRYRANLRFADAGFGAFLRRLRRAGLYDVSLIVLLADHGDAFFGHRVFGHNVHLYDDMTRIPLIVKFPASAGVVPRRISQLVQTIDVAPTILDYLEIERPAQLEGESLWPLARGAAGDDDRGVVTATVRRRKHAIRVGDSKYILDVRGSEELYDLAADPGERRNLVEGEPARARELRERLRALVDVAPDETKPQPTLPAADAATRLLLEELGYVDGAIPEE